NVVTNNATTINVGKNAVNNHIYRAAMYFSVYETYLKQGYRIYGYYGPPGADLIFSTNGPATGTITVYDQGASSPSAPTWTYPQIGSNVPVVGSFTYPSAGTLDVSTTIDNWFAHDLTHRWF